MRLIGLILLVAVLIVGYRQLATPEPFSQPTAGALAPPNSVQVPAPGAAPPPPAGSNQALPGGLSAAEVRTWCIANCEHHRFEELREGANTVVHMTTGIAATLNVPGGISIDGWDCFANRDGVGPTAWVGCEATFRRI